MTEAVPLHVCISGDLGSGKSSVARLVADQLNVGLVSTGDIQRSIAQELRVSTLGANLIAERDTTIDDRVDSVTRQVDHESQATLVFDSRMAWWFVRRAMKVRLIIDPEVAVKRILERAANSVEGYTSVNEAREQVAARYSSETRRFLARYGVNVARLRNFDLVIDSSDWSAKEVADEIVRSFEKLHQQDPPETRLLASPRRIVPAFDLIDGLTDLEPSGSPATADVMVAYARPFVFGLRGEPALRTALRRGDRALEVALGYEGDESVVAGLPPSSLSRRLEVSAAQAWAAEFGADLTTFVSWHDNPSVVVTAEPVE